MLTAEEQKISDAAVAEIKAQKNELLDELTDPSKYPAEKSPVSIFMAGSPGAGKTEVSLALLRHIESQVYDDGRSVRIIRIDPDEYRAFCSNYSGSNSALFQRAVSLLVDKVHDKVLKHRQSFIMDGTRADFAKAKRNIDRSLQKDRKVVVLYVYQDPLLAWQFVQKRELLEGRRILPSVFIDQYFSARDTVNQLKAEFGSMVSVDLLVKDTDHSTKFFKAGIDKVDNHVPEKYSRAQLEKLIHL